MGSKIGFNPSKGHSNLRQNPSQGDPFKGKKLDNYVAVKAVATKILEVTPKMVLENIRV